MMFHCRNLKIVQSLVPKKLPAQVVSWLMMLEFSFSFFLPQRNSVHKNWMLIPKTFVVSGWQLSFRGKYHLVSKITSCTKHDAPVDHFRMDYSHTNLILANNP